MIFPKVWLLVYQPINSDYKSQGSAMQYLWKMTRTARSLGQFLLLLCVFALVLSFPAQVDATGSCNASQVEVLYNGNTVTGSIKSGQNCSAYGYVKKYTCDGNVSVCNTNEQTIAQGNLPVSGTANPPCGKTVQIDVDMYQAQAWQGHLGGGGIARYGGACPSPTPKPTPKPTPTPTPTPKPSPSPSPTPRPTPSPTPTPVCVIDKLKVEPYPNPSDWVRTGEFKITNTGNFSMTFSWFLDIWGTSTGDKRGTQTLEPGASVTLGLGKICSKWQLDLECAGRERGFVIEPQACTTPTPTPTPTPKPSPSPSPTPRPTPSPTPTPRSCNYSCSSNSDCQSGLVCYQDGNSKYCRHPDNPGNSSCDTRKTGGFFIRKYHDEDGDGYQDSSEKGLSWKFQWDSNADNNWRDYETFSDKLGEGGVVNLPEGTQVRIREKAVDGWTATTPTEVTIRIRSGENQLMVFGNWRGKPSVLGTTTTRVLPATGGSLVIGGIGSIVMYGVGLWMKRKGL